MTKKELRKRFKEQRNSLSDKDMLRLDDLLLIQFQQWPLPDMHVLLSYWPIREKLEVNTHIMTDYLCFRIPGLQLAFPLMDMKRHEMRPVVVNDDTDYVL